MIRSRRLVLIALVAAIGAVTAGCPSMLGPDWLRKLGRIDAEGRLHGSLDAPAEVARGVPFDIVVTTYGSGTCTRPDGAEAQVDALLAVVRPYDLVPNGDAICTDDLAPFPRSVQLQFDLAGEATIRVFGRDGAQVEQQVTVRP